MKNLNTVIKEAKKTEYSIYFSYDNNSLAYHKYGDDNDGDKHGFKTIDELVLLVISSLFTRICHCAKDIFKSPVASATYLE